MTPVDQTKRAIREALYMSIDGLSIERLKEKVGSDIDEAFEQMSNDGELMAGGFRVRIYALTRLGEQRHNSD